jgi:hypothetical protein
MAYAIGLYTDGVDSSPCDPEGRLSQGGAGRLNTQACFL